MKQTLVVSLALALGAGPAALAQPSGTPPTAAVQAPAATPAITTVPGMPPVVDPANLYSETTAAHLSAAVRDALPRVYVPHCNVERRVRDRPATRTVVARFGVGLNPQHVVPSWDLKTLWVANNAENTKKGSLTPIDPLTGKPARPIPVDGSLQHVFHARTALGDRRRRGVQAPRLPRSAHDGAAVVARDTRLRRHQSRDFSIDGRYAIFTCEFSKGLAKIDFVDARSSAT
jgi:DNA-binding beta-propeller fold protein YncE